METNDKCTWHVNEYNCIYKVNRSRQQNKSIILLTQEFPQITEYSLAKIKEIYTLPKEQHSCVSKIGKKVQPKLQ